MTNLITLTRQQLNPAVIASFATLIGADSTTTATLVNYAIPLLLGSRGATKPGIAALVAVMAANESKGLAADGRRPLDTGLALIAALYGGKAELMARALAGATGTTISAATRALALAMFLVAGAATTMLAAEARPIARHQVAALLIASQTAAVAALPVGLQSAIASLPGLAGLYVVTGARRRSLAGLLLAGLVGTIVLFGVLLGSAW